MANVYAFLVNAHKMSLYKNIAEYMKDYFWVVIFMNPNKHRTLVENIED